MTKCIANGSGNGSRRQQFHSAGPRNSFSIYYLAGIISSVRQWATLEVSFLMNRKVPEFYTKCQMRIFQFVVFSSRKTDLLNTRSLLFYPKCCSKFTCSTGRHRIWQQQRNWRHGLYLFFFRLMTLSYANLAAKCFKFYFHEMKRVNNGTEN